MSRRSRFLKPLAKLVCKIQQQITFKLGILADFIRRSLQPCWRTFANWPQSKVENTVEVSVGVSHVQIWPGLISFSDLLLDIFESQQTYFSVRSQRIPKTGAKINYKHAESLRQKKKKKKQRPLLQITATIMKKSWNTFRVGPTNNVGRVYPELFPSCNIV